MTKFTSLAVLAVVFCLGLSSVQGGMIGYGGGGSMMGYGGGMGGFGGGGIMRWLMPIILIIIIIPLISDLGDDDSGYHYYGSGYGNGYGK